MQEEIDFDPKTLQALHCSFVFMFVLFSFCTFFYNVFLILYFQSCAEIFSSAVPILYLSMCVSSALISLFTHSSLCRFPPYSLVRCKLITEIFMFLCSKHLSTVLCFFFLPDNCVHGFVIPVSGSTRTGNILASFLSARTG